jgi:hypothetical protein
MHLAINFDLSLKQYDEALSSKTDIKYRRYCIFNYFSVMHQ